MSCAVFTLLGLYALIASKSNSWLISASFVAAVLLALVAAFLAWNKQYSDLESEKAKRGRPNVTAEFGLLTHKWYLSLSNSSEFPAVDIHIDDIRKATMVIRFGAVSSLRKDAFCAPSFGILRDGFTPADDLRILFSDEYRMDDIFDLRVRFSSLDSRADKKAWVLSAQFWYDHQQRQMVIQNQSIDSVK